MRKMLFVFTLLFSTAAQIFALPDTLIHEGIATWYYDENETTPACSFDWPDDGIYCALNTIDLHTNDDTALACGSFVHIKYIDTLGNVKEITCPVIDECPYPGACWDEDQLDLSITVFAELEDTIVGELEITWWFVEGEMTDPIIYHFHKDADSDWMAILVKNHRQAIKSLEMKLDSSWISFNRQSYNYFIYVDGTGDGPFDIRVTATTGEVLEDNDIQFEAGSDVQGAKNFSTTSLKGSSLKNGFAGAVQNLGSKNIFKAFGRTFKIPSAFFGNNNTLELYTLQGKLIKTVPIEASHIVTLPKQYSNSMFIVRVVRGKTVF